MRAAARRTPGVQRASAIIPAYNEAVRLRSVLDPVTDSGLFHRIVVVDDGSSDATASVAGRYGDVTLRQHGLQQGKGAALQTGIDTVDGDIYCFLDADLVGLTRRHLQALLRPVRREKLAMSVGVLDPPEEIWRLALSPVFSGQRALTAPLVERLPDLTHQGFGAEVRITRRAQEVDTTTTFVRLPGLNHIWKGKKRGLVQAGLKNMRMYLDIAGAWAAAQLEPPLGQLP